jgi:hypothetical protein
MMTEILADGRTYIHRMSAHCETGVTSALFLDKGIDLSEPMIFGIGSGIFFGHLPFLKWTGLPISTFVVRKKAWMSCAALFGPDKLSR